MNPDTDLEIFFPGKSRRVVRQLDFAAIRIYNTKYKSGDRDQFKSIVTVYRETLDLLDVAKGDRVILAKDPHTGEYCIAPIPRKSNMRGNTLCGPQSWAQHFDSRLLYNKLNTGYYRLENPFRHKLSGLTFYPLTAIGNDLYSSL
ncbi:MAG: hypothetical protein WCO63_16665 [Bacteroidota bacterium]